jgi:hypothetical protein
MRTRSKHTDGVVREKGVSLAKGPVAIIGLILLAYGVTGLIFGGQDFTQNAVDGTVTGETWLGIEGNGWTNVLAIAAGALLLFGSPLHWAAKSLGLIVGLALGAIAVIAAVDGSDALGIFAVNDATKWALGAASLATIVASLLPRVGGRERHMADEDRAVTERPVARDAVAEPATTTERTGRFRRSPLRHRDRERV